MRQTKGFKMTTYRAFNTFVEKTFNSMVEARAYVEMKNKKVLEHPNGHARRAHFYNIARKG